MQRSGYAYGSTNPINVAVRATIIDGLENMNSPEWSPPSVGSSLNKTVIDHGKDY